MTFQSEVCWDRDDLAAIARVTAEGFSDPAVFAATHNPSRLIKTAGTDRSGGQHVTEDDLLRLFKQPAGDDPAIIVVSGSAGTGKSHMVKWLHHRCADEGAWHQVYIEKHATNLRRVIETILAGLDGPNVREMRKMLDVAASHNTDLEAVKRRLLAELALRIQASAEEPDVSAKDRALRQLLPNVLNDPVLSKHLLAENGAVHRISRLSMEGVTDGDGNELNLVLSDGDLPLDPADLADAAEPTKRAVKQLASSETARRRAFEILNDELAVAKAAVFVGKSVSLSTVFGEIREELQQRGLELVLYIEDLVILHGIERELVQVFTEGRGRARTRCPMRVAIAVTSGYLDGLETLSSRAVHFSLDLSLDEAATREDGRTLIGRYLNAVRLGTTRLQHLYAQDVGVDWPPSRCSTCEHQEPCHAAFGADANGYGFYPLNQVAVDRIVRLTGRLESRHGELNPRDIVRHAVTDPLVEASDLLPLGEFPPPNFGATIDPLRESVSVDVRAQLNGSLDRADKRRTALLAFWAREPVQAVINLDPTIHEAFRLPQYTGAGEQATTPADDTPAPQKPERGDVGQAIDKWAQAIDKWANGEALTAEPARAIRKFILDALIESCSTGGHGVVVKVRTEAKSRSAHVGPVFVDFGSIRIEEAAGGGGSEVQRKFEISFKRNDATAVFLKSILVAANAGWSAAGETAYLNFCVQLDSWTSRLCTLATPQKQDLESATRVLAVTSQPRVSETSTSGERLTVMLQATADDSNTLNSNDRWMKSRVAARKAALDEFGRHLAVAKGTGATSVFDAASILHLLERANTMREFTQTPQCSEELQNKIDALRTAQADTATKRWDEVTKRMKQLEEWVPDTAKWEQFRSEIDSAIADAHDAGMLPSPDAKKELQTAGGAVPADAIITLMALRRKHGAATRSLWDVDPHPAPSLDALIDYCRNAHRLLNGVEADLDRMTREAGIHVTNGSVALDLRDVARALMQTTEVTP